MEKKIGDVENKMPHISGLVTPIVLKTKINEVGNKICDVSGLVKNQIMMLKYETLKENTLLLLIIINIRVK